MLAQRAGINVKARPESVSLVHMAKESTPGAGGGAGGGAAGASGLYLSVGLVSGVLIRLAVDAVTGDLSDMRQRYLGPKPVKLFRVTVQGQPGLVALTSRPWLMYSHQNRLEIYYY